MNAAMKLAKYFHISKKSAMVLSEAGYGTPAKIKAAKISDLAKLVEPGDIAQINKRKHF